VFGEHLDQDGPLRREPVALAHGRQRFLRQRDRLFFHHRHLVWVEAEDEVTICHRLELAKRVEQRQRVERDHVVRIVLEGALQRLAGLRLVARPQQSHPQAGVRRRIGIVQRQAPARQRDGLVEQVVARRVIAGNAVDVAVDRVDGEDRLDLIIELGLLAFHEVHGGLHAQGLEALRIHRQGLVDGLARIVAPPVVEGHFSRQQMRVDGLRIHLERLLDGFLGRGRVARRGDGRQAEPGRHVVLVHLQRRLERLQSLRPVVLLEEQLAPRRVDHGILRRQAGGVPVQIVRRLVLSKGSGRGGGARVFGRRPGRQIHHTLEHARGIGSPALQHLQPAQFERGVAGGVGGGGRLQ
jgi:hypothetical protein